MHYDTMDRLQSGVAFVHTFRDELKIILGSTVLNYYVKCIGYIYFCCSLLLYLYLLLCNVCLSISLLPFILLHSILSTIFFRRNKVYVIKSTYITFYFLYSFRIIFLLLVDF